MGSSPSPEVPLPSLGVRPQVPGGPLEALRDPLKTWSPRSRPWGSSYRTWGPPPSPWVPLRAPGGPSKTRGVPPEAAPCPARSLSASALTEHAPPPPLPSGAGPLWRPNATSGRATNPRGARDGPLPSAPRCHGAVRAAATRMRSRAAEGARRSASGAGSGREEEEEAVMAAGHGPRICEGECAVLKRGDVFKAVAVLRRR